MPGMNTERRMISEVRPGETLDQVFLVRDKDLRTTKTGDLYITCTLCDRSGALPARMWQASEKIFQSIPTDGYLHAKGRVDDYRGQTQFIIDACRPFPEGKVDLADFIPVTELDVEQMWAELLEILRAVKDKPLRLLIKKFVEDRELVAAFKRAPAAMDLHNPFIGGLLEHTLAIAKAAKALLPLYPKLNADLVLTSVLLHYIGKTAELSAGTTMKYTDRGQLIGHITIAAIWTEQKAAAVAEETGEPFPQRTLDCLQHIILSHHGQREWGSPVLPAIPEAFFLHYLDNLDAKMYMTLHAVATDADPEASFTNYIRQIQTRIYKHSGAGE